MGKVDRVPEKATIIGAPILDGKDDAEPSAFTRDSLASRVPTHVRNLLTDALAHVAEPMNRTA